MSGKRNWRKAQLSSKRSLSTRDEAEYRGRDAAARWLERREKPVRRPPKQSERIAS